MAGTARALCASLDADASNEAALASAVQLLNARLALDEAERAGAGVVVSGLADAVGAQTGDSPDRRATFPGPSSGFRSGSPAEPRSPHRDDAPGRAFDRAWRVFSLDEANYLTTLLEQHEVPQALRFALAARVRVLVKFAPLETRGSRRGGAEILERLHRAVTRLQVVA